MGKADRVSERERAAALEALRACCQAAGRGVSGTEFEEYCAARGLGRPWRRHYLTTRGGVHAWPWNEVVRSVGFEPPPNRRRRAPAAPPPGARRCQNAPECTRSPIGKNRFCGACQSTWAHYAPDCGVASFVRTTR